MTVWENEAYELSMQGLNAKEIERVLATEYNGVTYSAIKNKVRRMRKANGTTRDKSGMQVGTSATSVQECNGVKTYNDTFEIDDGEVITPASIMVKKGLNPAEWEVVSFTKNIWQQQTKDGDTINLCQSKLTVKPYKKLALTIEDVDKWFDEKDFSKVPIKEKKLKKSNGNLIAEICCADIHFGMLAWANECSNDWDLHIAREKFLEVIFDIVDRLKNDNISEVYFCTLGDVLHVDNVQGTTTKGTVQQVDGRISKIIDYAYDTLNVALEKVRELGVPITYIYVSGNHDTAMGYALVRMLEIANSDITFERSPNPQKAIHFGKVLIGLNHGDIPKANKGQWLIHDYRKEYGESLYVEVHSGHFHNESVNKYNGILERSLLAQTGQSLWEYSQAYRSQRGIQCFVWDKEKGLRDIKYSIYQEGANAI